MVYDNTLELTGKHAYLSEFRRQNQAEATLPDGKKVLLPLCFRALMPRPPALDVPESPGALRIYQALYGDWEVLLTQDWAIEAEIRNRQSLIYYLEATDPENFSLAQRYRANEAKFGVRNFLVWNRQRYGVDEDLGPNTTVEGGADFLIYRFRTLGGTPHPWFETVRSIYPALTMKLRSELSKRTWLESFTHDIVSGIRQ